MSDAKVGVVGAGSWGTALSALLAERGHRVLLWALELDVVEQINEDRENASFLPGVRLPDALEATGSLEQAVADAAFVVSVSPSQFVAATMTEAARHLRPDALVVSASKGIETSSLRRMDEVLGDILGPEHAARLTVLSGPSFAAEVAAGQPTAVVAASHDPEAAQRVQALFRTSAFRVYTNSDVVGVELGGALKNVIAIAAGIAAGLGFGHNTRAAVVTRGLAEITRLGVAMGAEQATFAGLAGMGDLVLTCTGELSRNRTVGYRLGQGETLAAILGPMSAVAEGVKTTEAAVALAARHGVEMPITSEIHQVLTRGKDPRKALNDLMTREPKPEQWW